MEVTDAQFIEVVDLSQVSDARRKITNLGAEQGLDQKTIDRVALVCTELASNLVKHSTGGIIIAQGLSIENNQGLEIFAMDKGPGMDDVELCSRDGYSSLGSLGTGLGAITRLSDSSDICSSRSHGTIIQSRIWQNKQASADENVGGMTVPLDGQRLSGDKWAACQLNEGLYCILVDGLGHGFEASEAASQAVALFRKNLSLSPEKMMSMIHKNLQGSRGAVGALAKIDFTAGKLNFVGLGNITAILVNGSVCKQLTSLNGTLGHEVRKILEFTLPWTAQSLLVMHSDGFSSQVSLDPVLTMSKNKSASLIAAGLYLNHYRTTDDASVMVVKRILL